MNDTRREFLVSASVFATTSLFPFASRATAQPSLLKIVSSLPDLSEMVSRIAGPLADCSSFLSGSEDPHFMDATPALMKKAAAADLVFSMGLQLESAWLKRVVAKTGRPLIQPGGPGYLELGSTIQPLDKKFGAINRSMGDVHAEGNPHFNLSPRAMSQASNVVEKTLISLRPDQATELRMRADAFRKSMSELEAETRALLTSKPLLIEYHKEFAYFLDLYGLKSIGSIEDKPGIPPSGGRLAEISLRAKKEGVRLAIAATFAPRSSLQKFQELSGVPFSIVPTAVRPGSKDAGTLRDVQITLARAITAAR